MTSVIHNEQAQDCTLPPEAVERLKRLGKQAEDDVLNTEALRIIRAIWPDAFNVIAPKPLKIGIHKDMEDKTQGRFRPLLSARRCVFLRRWTSSGNHPVWRPASRSGGQ